MVNLDLIRNLANLIVADADEGINHLSDESDLEKDCLDSCKRKAEKILKALDETEGGKSQ